MDLATVIGFLAGNVLIVIVMIMSGSLIMYWDFLSLVIVLGGSFLAVLMRNDVGGFIRGLLYGLDAFFNKVEPPEEVIDRILNLAQVARKGSILALEKETIEDPFMSKGIKLAVDGTDPGIVSEILQDDINILKRQLKDSRQIFDDLAEASPAFGMIGTVIGLVVIMANLSDPSKIGPGLAVALITTLYGAMLANVMYMPISSKLKLRATETVRNCEITRIGIMSIMSGLNPTIIRNRLKGHLQNGGEEG